MSAKTANPKEGDLRMWWIPQVPGKSFTVSVPDVKTGKFLCRVLADYDAFQFKHRIKPDYANVGGINVFEDGDWVDLEDEEEG